MMKKVVLSTAAVFALSGIANADTNSELKALKAQMAQMAQKIEALEAEKSSGANEDDVAGIEAKMTALENNIKKNTVITSKSPKIDFSGTHYLGFVSSDDNILDNRTNAFETRRNYFQAKAYFKDNPKDYLRITLDTYQNTKEKDGEDKGSWELRLKYAYLYMDEILPYTGVEIGQVHRPWIDYEEHNAWLYRSVSKVFVEDKGHGVDFTNSADLGVNFKTALPYFSSELGVFNGEGYHALENGEGLSAEWRLTGHLLGTGEEKANKDLQYANVSFFGQMHNNDYKGRGDASGNFDWYGIHAVYNQPEFLVAAQYIKTQNAKTALKGSGYSINGEYRFMPDFSLIGMYNSYNYDSAVATDVDKMDGWLAGVAYNYNKNVTFIVNYLSENKDLNNGTKSLDKDSIMATAEVKW
jgi:uncharacterized protein (UPF0335 family)